MALVLLLSACGGEEDFYFAKVRRQNPAFMPDFGKRKGLKSLRLRESPVSGALRRKCAQNKSNKGGA
jgi:hypothetical protein